MIGRLLRKKPKAFCNLWTQRSKEPRKIMDTWEYYHCMHPKRAIWTVNYITCISKEQPRPCRNFNDKGQCKLFDKKQ